MDLIGISAMDNIQKRKYIAAEDYANLARNMDCQQPGICESKPEKKYCWKIIEWHNERTV